MPNRLFIHGLAERMARLRQVVGDTTGWTLIGSSLGGLVAAVFASQQPDIEMNSVTAHPSFPLSRE